MVCKIIPILLVIVTVVAAPAHADIRVARVEGAIDPATAAYIVDTLKKAEDSGDIYILEIDTPGGLMESMRDIASEFLNTTVPVIVYVTPSGARAASAGVFISAAAHIVAMAPGTHMGAAHPVGIGGAKMDSVMAGKVENDAAAQMRAIAEKRGRNATWYEDAVRKSVSATAEEALELGIIDIIADTRAELLEYIDGKQVTVIDDEILTISSEGETVVETPMSFRFKLLHELANPNLAYIFLLLGFYGLYFELSNPGSIFPGVVGGILLLLGLFALQMMPVNYVGVLLIAFAMVLFLAEIKIPSHGLLTIGGVVALVLGSLMLFDTTEALYRVSWSVLLPAVLMTVAFFMFAVGMGIRAQRRQPTTGREGLIGLEGEVVEPLNPKGKVFLNGEYWFAETDGEEIRHGETVRVQSVEGMTLHVKRIT